jgi:hypothetical protein
LSSKLFCVRPPAAYLEAFFAIEPSKLLVVHSRSVVPEQDKKAPIAKLAADGRELRSLARRIHHPDARCDTVSKSYLR